MTILYSPVLTQKFIGVWEKKKNYIFWKGVGHGVDGERTLSNPPPPFSHLPFIVWQRSKLPGAVGQATVCANWTGSSHFSALRFSRSYV